MNPQGRLQSNRVIGGIEWLTTTLPDGRQIRGYTWNPIAGCRHACRWQMPDGQIAICYAEAQAHGLAQASYPDGFDHHYFHPHRLDEPLRHTQPARIFLDSMSDIAGHWVPRDQVEAVLDVCRRAHWHTFLLLTKNAPGLLQLDLPDNVHTGISMPPDWMWGKRLTRRQQERMLRRGLEILASLAVPVTWCSFEPLSYDVAGIVADYPDALHWAVIGAASNGRVTYQPEPVWVKRLVRVLDEWGVPVFYKGNLRDCSAAEPWREELPR